MKNLIINRTSQSPKVELNNNGELSISGVSTTNDAQKFYTLILDWISEFKKAPPEQINLVLELYYVNTASSSMLVKIINQINELNSEKTAVRIVWRYEEEDEDIFSFGEEIEMATNSRFEYTVVS